MPELTTVLQPACGLGARGLSRRRSSGRSVVGLTAESAYNRTEMAWDPGMRRIVFVCRGVLVLAAIVPLGAASRSRTATATVTVAALAKLSLSASTLSFPDANPDTVPTIPRDGRRHHHRHQGADVAGQLRVSLSVLASDDLRSGVSTIPVVGHALDGQRDRLRVGNDEPRRWPRTWAPGSDPGSRVGTQSYTLTNSWTYATGIVFDRRSSTP